MTCGQSVGGGEYCWGLNLNGQLGDGTSTDRSTPVPVSGLTSGADSISLGWFHTCAALLKYLASFEATISDDHRAVLDLDRQAVGDPREQGVPGGRSDHHQRVILDVARREQADGRRRPRQRRRGRRQRSGPALPRHRPTLPARPSSHRRRTVNCGCDSRSEQHQSRLGILATSCGADPSRKGAEVGEDRSHRPADSHPGRPRCGDMTA